jgi:hypothetical protein
MTSIGSVAGGGGMCSSVVRKVGAVGVAFSAVGRGMAESYACQGK